MTVAAIAVPQAMAYALIAGVDPRFGLYSAIVVTALGSIFGSSQHLINGPTNAISLLVFSGLAFLDPDAGQQTYEAMFLLAMMAGVIQIGVAMFRLGDLTRYISDSVVRGFMAGAGFLVALSQFGNVFGIQDKGTGHQHLLHRLWLTATTSGPINYRALAITVGTVVFVVLGRRLARRHKLPRVDMLAALILASLVASACGWLEPGSDGKPLIAVVGRVPRELPSFHVPELRMEWIREMWGSATAIAFLGLLEALAIAQSIAGKTRQPLDYNAQCLAEGLANLGGGLFQCLPGSGSLTRSSINFNAGAVTKWSGVYSAATVALVVVSLAPLAHYIPKSALAGLLLVTAAGLVDWQHLLYTLRASAYDAALVVATSCTAVFLGVEFSILVGTMLSILLYVPRAARLQASELVVGADRSVRARTPTDPVCTKLVVLDLEGELFFGAARELERIWTSTVTNVAPVTCAQPVTPGRTRSRVRESSAGPSAAAGAARSTTSRHAGRSTIAESRPCGSYRQARRFSKGALLGAQQRPGDRTGRGVCGTCKAQTFSHCARSAPARIRSTPRRQARRAQQRSPRLALSRQEAPRRRWRRSGRLRRK